MSRVFNKRLDNAIKFTENAYIWWKAGFSSTPSSEKGSAFNPFAHPIGKSSIMSEASASVAKRVLVVDDNSINRHLASTFIERLGYVVEQASDGPAALTKLVTSHYDIVFLDISMPGMSGEDVLAKIRADGCFGNPRVIAYTAHALPEEKRRLIDAGFDDLLIKPITLASVREALGGS